MTSKISIKEMKRLQALRLLNDYKHFWRDAIGKVTVMATKGSAAYIDPEAGNEKVEMYERNLIEVDSDFKGTVGDLLFMINELKSDVQRLERELDDFKDECRNEY